MSFVLKYIFLARKYAYLVPLFLISNILFHFFIFCKFTLTFFVCSIYAFFAKCFSIRFPLFHFFFYMPHARPQEVALYGEFTLRETLIYFGMISAMARSDVDDRTEFLLKFLNLPNGSRQVKNLSGGQQRRMSLAVVLLHEPELLILDEPTVGVDPVLRQR